MIIKVGKSEFIVGRWAFFLGAPDLGLIINPRHYIAVSGEQTFTATFAIPNEGIERWPARTMARAPTPSRSDRRRLPLRPTEIR
jgi:hypothetical protein